MNGEVVDQSSVSATGFARSAKSWAVALAFGLTGVAAVLNVASARLVGEFCADRSLRNDPASLLAVLSSPLALLLATVYAIWTRCKKGPLTLDRTLLWGAFSVLSIVAWPLSFLVAAAAFMFKGFLPISRC
jgi:hypothetical protein